MQQTEFTVGKINAVQCYKEGWERIKSDYWILFAIALVGGLIGGFTMYILLGAMICGIFLCFLRKIDTGAVSFDDLWKGFGFFVPGLIVTIIVFVPIFIIYGIIYVPILMAAMSGGQVNQDEFLSLLFGAMAIDAVLLIAVVCFHTLLMFAFPLIVDRKLSAIQAIKTSMRAVWQNLGGVIGLIGVQILLSIAGMLTCGLGFYFLMPVMMAGLAVAYRRVFPLIDDSNYNYPPPPPVYQ